MSSSSSASIQAGLLPPFELRRLIRPVFAPDPSPADAASLPPPQPGPSKNPVIRSVDGHGQLLWVGSNDGRVRGLDIKANSSPRRTAHNRVASDTVPVSDSSEPQPRPASLSGRLSKPSSPRPPDGTLTGIEDMIDTSCFQDCQVFPATDKSKPKPVEKLILVPMVGLAIILSGQGAVLFIHQTTSILQILFFF